MFWYKDELLDLERLQAQDNGIHFYLKDHVVGETKENSAGEDKKSEAEQLKSEIKKEFGLKECGTTKEQEAEQLNETNTSFQTCKTWTNGKDLIYRTIGDLTKGIVEDGDWSHVSELFKKIEDLGGSVSYSAKNGTSENGSVFRNGYMFTKDSDRPSAKVYEFTVDFTNQEGNQVLIDGELTCSFAGKEDEFIPEKYDMSVVMWKGREEA